MARAEECEDSAEQMEEMMERLKRAKRATRREFRGLTEFHSKSDLLPRMVGHKSLHEISQMDPDALC